MESIVENSVQITPKRHAQGRTDPPYFASNAARTFCGTVAMDSGDWSGSAIKCCLTVAIVAGWPLLSIIKPSAWSFLVRTALTAIERSILFARGKG